MSRRFALFAVLPVAGACAPPSGGGENASGTFTRAAFHLMVECDGAEYARKSTIVYPANTEASTYVIEDRGGDLVVRYGDEEIGSGRRDGDALTIDLTRIDDDPDAAVSWRLRGRIERSLPFHTRTLVGHLEPAAAPFDGEDCSFGSRNVVWWAEEPDPEALVSAALGGVDPDPVLGAYDLFAWWVRLGSVSPDPQKGADRATIAGDLISLALSPDPRIEAGDDGAVRAHNGVTAPGVGIADPTGLWFEQGDHLLVDVSVSQAVIAGDDGAEGQEAGVQRVLAGFVDGSLYIDPDFYPTGVTGPSGWLKIDRPGLAFWEDVDYGPGGEPGAAAAARPLRVLPMSGRQHLVDGVLQ